MKITFKEIVGLFFRKTNHTFPAFLADKYTEPPFPTTGFCYRQIFVFKKDCLFEVLKAEA